MYNWHSTVSIFTPECASNLVILQHHDGVEEEDVSGSVPQSWAKFSKNNVEESQGMNLVTFDIKKWNVSKYVLIHSSRTIYIY